MKKNYFMLVCLVLLSAFSATAQVASVADLFGKYRFTADVEFTEEGQSYKDVLSGDCDATIEEDGTYIAKIVGFAGSQVQQNINAISIEKNMVKVLNPNNPVLWNNGLMLANENGDNPYGVFNSETSKWDVESYGPVYYTFDPATKNISIPDFTVITVANTQTDAKGTIIAKYTNVKMTLVETQTIEVADISGDWNFTAGSGAYDTLEGSVIPKDFSIALAKSGDDNRAYTATIAIEGYNNIELPATFDGNTLALAYDETYLDETNGIRFAPMYGSAKKGTIEFKSQSETTFTLYSGFSFASDKMGKTQDETADSLIVNGEYHQWYIAGTLKNVTGGSQAFTWDGTWNVKVASASDVIVADDGASGVEWPTEFQMNVTYYEATDAYYVDNFMGFDLYNLNNGGLLFTPYADGTGASITLDGGSYQIALLKSNGDGTFLQLTNQNGVTTPGINITRNDDGTFAVEPFFVQNLDFNTGATKPVVFYNSSVATKEGAVEPVEPAFSWIGTHTVKVGKIDSYDGKEYPTEFTMTIVQDGEYTLVTEFLGNNIAAANYGGITFTIAEDCKSAEMTTGGYVGGSYPSYLKIYDMNATTSPLQFTLNEDGSVTVANFFVKHYDYETMEETAAAYFQNNVIPATGGSEPEEPAFSWVGTHTVNAAKVTAYDGKEYPKSFDMTVVYDETYSMYMVTTFIGNDVAALNYGGIAMSVAEDGKSATIATGSLVGGAYPEYLVLKDMNAGNEPIKLVLNEDGTVSVDNFFVQNMNYNTNETSPAAYYENVTIGGEVTEPEEPAFDWAGDYAFSGEPVSKDGSEYPASFEVVVTFYEATEYNDAMYCVTSFMGNDVNAINYGGILLTVAEDGKSATLANGNVMSLGGGTFLKIFDANGAANPVAITLNEDGTLSMADFTVVMGAWGNDVDNTVVAEYKNGILVKGGEVTEPEEPVGPQYRIKCDAGYLNIGNTDDHPTGPVGGVNVVEYAEDNNQIFTIEDAGDGNVYLKSVSGYYIYCHQWNVDGKESEKTALTFEEVGENKFYIKQAGGYFKVENVGGVNYPFCDAAISIAAVWSLEEVGSTGIENVKGEDANVNGVYDLSGRKLEQITAPGLYIINGKKVLVK